MAEIKRYIIYAVTGILIELVRLAIFRMMEDSSVFLANLVSIFLSLIVSFWLHGKLAWKDRGGSIIAQFIAFCQSKAVLWILKLIALPLMTLANVICPLYKSVDWGLNVVAYVSPILADMFESFLTCSIMQAVVVDAVIGFTVGYVLHNKWTFRVREAT